MTEETDKASKTEEPTGKRLDEARRSGDVAKSPDITSWATLAAVAGTIAIYGGWACRDLAGRLVPFLEAPDAFSLEDGGAVDVLRRAVGACAPVLSMVLAAAMVSGVVGNVLQQGFMFSPDKLKPDFSKLNPIEGFKRLFNIDGVAGFVRSLIKLTIVSSVVWLTMGPHLPELANLSGMEPAAILPFAATLLRSLAITIVTFLGAGAMLDWVWQRYRFHERMKMSREEVKDEVKQSEGDPEIKARLRRIRFERARKRMIQRVPKATVVIANPTHFAVALLYKQGETDAPICVAKGVDALALKIREVAEEARVPVIEDPPLARALYASVEVDEVIPVGHYQAVAKIIGFVLNQARRRAARIRPSSGP